MWNGQLHDSTLLFCLFRCSQMEALFNNDESRLAVCASRAVGVPKEGRKWYIAIVGFNTEKSSNKKLTSLGFETYLPVQEYISVWKDGRRKKRERIVIPTVIFTKLLCCFPNNWSTLTLF